MFDEPLLPSSQAAVRRRPYLYTALALCVVAGIIAISVAASTAAKSQSVTSAGNNAAAGNSGTTSAPTAAPTQGSTTTTNSPTVAAATNAPTVAPTTAPTAAPTVAVVAAQGTSVVTTFTGNAFSPQCSNGQWALFGYGLSVTENVNNTGATQPMAEHGLGTYNMLFYLNGQAAALTVSNTFNVGNSMSSGNAWTFSLLDDQPNIGGNFLIGTSGVCTQNQAASTVSIQAAFTTTTLVNGTLPNNFFNVLPTVVNNLAAANQFGGTTTTTSSPTAAPTKAPTSSTATSAPTSTPTAAPTKAPTTATTTSAPTAVAGQATTVVTTFTGNAFSPQCSNGQWALFGYGLSVTENVNNTGATQPMAEHGLGTYNMLFYLNNQAAPVTVSGTFNVANSKFSSNAWTFDLLDDQPNIGGSFLIGTSGVCTQNQAASTVSIQAAFTTTTLVNGTLPNNFFNVLPTVVNNLAAANQFGGTTTTTSSPTAAPTKAPTSSTTTSAPTSTPTAAPTTAATSAPTKAAAGTSTQLTVTQNFDSLTALSGAAPTWQTVTPSCSGTGALALTSTVAASAPNSMAVTGVDGFCNHIFLGTTGVVGGSDFYVRFKIRLANALGTGHVTLVTMIDSLTGKNIRFGGQSNVFIWNRETDDATLPILSPQGIALSLQPAAATWYCVEFGWVHVGSRVNVTTWINGTQIVGLSNGNPTADANWATVAQYNLTTLNFGYEGYGSAGNNNVWYDDIATAGARIGC